MRSDLSSRGLFAEKYVTVMSTVPGCDVTTVQQHYKGSTSTPLRVARLCQIREASLVALRKISKIYSCSHVLIVRLDQSTIRVSRDFHCHSSPLYHLPGELVSLSSVPMPSIDLNLWNLSRPSAFVPMSLGFTSVLTDDIVRSSEIPNLDLATCSLFRCHCACCADRNVETHVSMGYRNTQTR